jgi:methionyl-tRNA formyltransferase
MELPIRTIFLGTPTFALDSLQELLNEPWFKVVGVVTQPDRAVGRNQTQTPPPVKKLALTRHLTVLQPEKIRTIAEDIRALKPDLIVVVAFGQIIPEEILQIPRYGCVNVHGSLLPKYRGAAVIQAPILNGDTTTGVTIMKLDKGLDTGPILSQQSIPVADNETAATLFVKLSALGAKLLVPTLKKYITGALKPYPQDDTKASYVRMLNKNDARIDWTRSAHEIERLVRAMQPWPIAWTLWQGKMLKIKSVQSDPIQVNQYKQGQVFINGGQLSVQCGINALNLLTVQLEGKIEMSAADFLRGQANIVHQVLT